MQISKLLPLLIPISIILLYYKGSLLFDFIDRLARIIKLKIFGPDRFTPLEKTILSVVREKLTGEMAELWDKQLLLINQIQRYPTGTEVNLYPIYKGEISFSNEVAFPNKRDFCIATLDIFSRVNNNIKIRARVWSIGGHVFSIDYVSSSYEFEKKVPPEDWIIKCHIEKQH